MRARDNPFRVDRQQAMTYRLPGISWEELSTRLREMNHRGAIVGPHGSGKTTLLSHLERHLTRDGLLVETQFVNASTRSPWRAAMETPILAPGEILLFDGFGHLPRWAQWRVDRRTRRGGLIVTLHEPGRLPTILTCRPTVQLLQELVTELAGDENPVGAQVPTLFDKHRGNIRDALRELYDVYAMVD